MKATRKIRSRGRKGNALLEFVLVLPIIFFMTGLIMYMSFGMLTKQKAVVEARRALWSSAGHGIWTDMKLEGYTPGTVEDDGTRRPRGSGEELERLRPDVEPSTIAATTDAMARDYWYRIWDNLPGRHEAEASRSFQTTGTMWNFLRKTAAADHHRDSSPWHYHHIDAWRIARSGPLREIFESFRDNLQEGVAPHFDQTREDILRRWWHAQDILDNQQPSEYDAG